MSSGVNTSRRQFSWYMSGQGLWFASHGLQTVVFPWLVADRVGGSPEQIGLAQMAFMLPMLLFALLGGTVADRQDLRIHLMRLQMVAAVPSIALAFYLAGGGLNYWILVGQALLFGTAGAFVMPARDSMLVRVAQGRIQRTVAIATFMQFAPQVVGLALGGLAVYTGAAPLFLLQALILAGSALATGRLMPAPPAPSTRRRNRLYEMREGVLEVWNRKPVRIVAFTSFVGGTLNIGPYWVVFPLLIRDVYKGDSDMLSLVFISFQAGVMVSALTISRLPHIRRPGRTIMCAMWGGSIVMAVMHFTPPFPIVLLLGLFWGVSAGANMSTARTLIQEAAPDSHRARILAVYQTAMLGGGPVGAMGMGLIAGAIGPLDALFVPAVAMAIIWSILFLSSNFWRIEASEHDPEGATRGAS